MFLKAKKISKDDIKENSGGYINKPGIYDIEILTMVIDVTKSGAIVVNPYVEYNKVPQVVYGNLLLQNSNGDENEIGMRLFNKLRVITGVEDVEDPVDETLPIGKGEKPKDVQVITEFDGAQVKMAVTVEYGIWNGNITERTLIQNFYTESGLTAAELLDDVKTPKKIEKDTEYYSNCVYRDGLTKEQVDEWIKNKRPRGTASKSANSGETKKTYKRRSFGK